MSTQPDPLDEIADAVRALFDQAYDERTDLLEQFAAEHAERAKRLNSAATRLKARLGADDPRVATLTSAAAGAEQLQQSLRTTATRATRRPELKRQQWMVYGNVVDPAGQPVAGVRVRVLDRDGKLSDRLGDATTDEFGDFAVVFSERAFFEQGDKRPDLFVVIEDAKGKVVFSSEENVLYEAGRAEYFAITLSERPAVKPPKGKGPARPPATRKPSARNKP